tara:strand:+ start:616 stop:2136 length:1521 start_codon:yes stop_codon:yes gene_type:complete
MSRLDNAVVVDSNLFSSIAGEAKEAVFEYRLTMPFKVDKEHKPDHDDDDVVVYGPVYVGDESMLDRHKELVDAKAIMESWESYKKNPVILYNHRKDYGVIGLMESVEMGMFEKPDGEKIEAVFGRARIDGGEKDITRKINKGMLRAFSIGFIAKAGVKQGSGDEEYLTFTEIEWIETSVVDIPASPNALFGVSKSLISYDGEKHIIAVEERDESYVVEFAKADMEDEPAPPTEGTELSFDAEILVELSDTIAGLEAKIAGLQEQISQPIDGDTVKGHGDSQQAMTEEEIAVNEVTEEVVELSAPEEEIKTTEVVEVKSEETEEVLEEETEEVVEEAAEEVLEEELPEEVVEESADEPVDEELADELVELSEETTGVEVLAEVVNALTSVETGLKDLVARLDESDNLKTMLAERDATIASLTESKAAAEAEAQIEAEVSRRLGEKMAEIGMPAPSAPSAQPKSLSPTPKTVTVKSGPTRHDPQPEVSQGMASLGSWLSGRLAGKMIE